MQKHIVEIRRVYNEELRDNRTVIRQRATAMYLIDKVRHLNTPRHARYDVDAYSAASPYRSCRH